jgi:hypothetical protein
VPRRAVALSLVGAALLAPYRAGARDVFAQGRPIGDRCVFPDGLRIPGGHGARIDDTCAVFLAPLTDPAQVSGGGSDAMAKSYAGDPNDAVSPTVVPGLPGGGTNVSHITDEAGALADQAVRAATGLAAVAAEEAQGAIAGGVEAASTRAYVGWTHVEVENEFGQRMYKDYQEFEYRRRIRDGRLLPPTNPYGYCMSDSDPVATNPVDYAVEYVLAAPYDADVLTCWTRIGEMSGSRFEFVSSGTFETWVRSPYEVIGARYDFRRTRAYFVTFDHGFYEELTSCDVGGELPEGWKTVECRAGEGGGLIG